MIRYCSYCGAELEENAKICVNCGKVIPASQQSRPQQRPLQRKNPINPNMPNMQNTPQNNQRRTGNVNQQRNTQRKIPPTSQRMPTEMQDIPRRVYEHPKRAEAEEHMRMQEQQQARYIDRSADTVRKPQKSRKNAANEKHEKKVRTIKAIILIFISIAVIIFAFCFVRIFTVSHSGYEFKTEMNLESTTYSEAFGKYFKSGSWGYNILENKVYYKGTNSDGKSYIIEFARKDGQNYVNYMSIDGKEEKSDNLMQNEIMSMFMATKSQTD